MIKYNLRLLLNVYIFIILTSGSMFSQNTINSTNFDNSATLNSNLLGPEDSFESRMHPFGNINLPYRLFIPKGLDQSKRYPIVIALHGSGERGSDNKIQLHANQMATSWADSTNQAKYPCYVLAPQCPSNRWWLESSSLTGQSYNFSQTSISQPAAAVVDLLDSLIQVYPIDTNRIYLTGLSMGGFGTWDLIMRYPNRFAAAVPMSSYGDPTQVKRIINVPIWNFHGDNDGTVSVTGSRNMVEAFINNGRQAVYTHCNRGVCSSNPDSIMDAAVADNSKLLYSEYAGQGHVIWNQSYALRQLHKWVFMQSLDNNIIGSTKELQAIPGKFSLSQNYPNPFNPTTTIRYSLIQSSHVKLIVYNLLGQKIKTLIDSFQNTGQHSIIWNGKDDMNKPISSGIYFYRLESGKISLQKKMLLIR